MSEMQRRKDFIGNQEALDYLENAARKAFSLAIKSRELQRATVRLSKRKVKNGKRRPKWSFSRSLKSATQLCSLYF